MTDKREQIIARLDEIVRGLELFKTTERNFVAFDDTQLPAASVLEGDEEPADEDKQRQRPVGRPALITALPQVYIRVGATKAGTDLNTLRATVIKAVLLDASLNAMSVNGIGVSYRGMQSTLHSGRWSEMPLAALMFAITYKLDPNQI